MPSNNNLEGGGPWQFDLPELQPGESWFMDAENREYNGTKGYFRKWLPFDYAQVTNLSADNGLRVTYNGIYEDTIVPNASESYSDQGITEVRIYNAGSTAIPAGQVSLSVGVDPYGADDAARERARRGPIAQVAEHLTGLSLDGV